MTIRLQKSILFFCFIFFQNILIFGQEFNSIIEADKKPEEVKILDLSEKPTTLILDNPRNVAKNIVAEDSTLGVRIVTEPFCFKLMERMKKPLVSTSANISGEPTPKTFKEISPEIIKGVDYVVNLHHDKVCKNPSTIIKLGLDSQVKVIRK